ncbi:putative calcium-binding protein cml10 [Fagus crenata]|jgi:Ca2+-binding EF-hand superfamily protein
MLEYSQNIPQKQPLNLLKAFAINCHPDYRCLLFPKFLSDNMVRIAKQLPPINPQQLRDTFKKYDSNDDGFLSKAELENAFKSLGSHLPGWRARRALHHADANGDNSISLEELDEVVKYAMKHGYVLGK